MAGGEFIFLFGLGFVWVLFATVSDIKTKEIPNWLNFSLIAFALSFRFFYSLFLVPQDFSILYQGIIGLAIFFVLGEIFYYGKLFAGGDKKLFVGLGAVLPFFPDFFQNLNAFLVFFLLFFFSGAVYGIAGSIFISLKNPKKFKRGFKVLFKRYKRNLIFSISFGIIALLAGFFVNSFLYIGIILFLFPYFFLFIKTVDDFCMVREVPISKITPGDWLYKDVRIGKKIIKATWSGLSESDIKLLRMRGKVKIRYGIIFAPVFLISFVLLGILLYWGLLDKFLFGLF